MTLQDYLTIIQSTDEDYIIYSTSAMFLKTGLSEAYPKTKFIRSKIARRGKYYGKYRGVKIVQPYNLSEIL